LRARDPKRAWSDRELQELLDLSFGQPRSSEGRVPEHTVIRDRRRRHVSWIPEHDGPVPKEREFGRLGQKEAWRDEAAACRHSQHDIGGPCGVVDRQGRGRCG
jgi:hypothetical protein